MAKLWKIATIVNPLKRYLKPKQVTGKRWAKAGYIIFKSTT